MLEERGFSLLEMLIAMTLTGMIIVSAITLLPQLQLQSLNLYRAYRLELTLTHALFGLEKDLRRAGFVFDHDENSVLKSPLLINQSQSCVIIHYDLNRNGSLEDESEFFAYRWLNGALEQQRGSPDCSGIGWERLLDPAEINITLFKLEQYSGIDKNKYIEVTLQGHWQKKPEILKTVTHYVRNQNLYQ